MSKVENMTEWRAHVAAASERAIAELDVELHGPAASQHARATPGGEAPEQALARAEWAFTTRRVDPNRAASLVTEGRPAIGDLVLARVDALGHHVNVQRTDGRRRRLFPGDTIVVAYGNRYASEQFEAEMPTTLGPCHLVAAGGVAARARTWHARITRGPTRITPLGLLADPDGRRLNLEHFAIPAAPSARQRRPLVIAVLGTGMDAGKTQTAAFLLRGLRAHGLRTGYVKATGTGAGNDLWLLRDAGADAAFDFTDAGLPSTYLLPTARIERAMLHLIDVMAAERMGAVVMEVADGVLQRETSALLDSEAFQRTVDGIVLAAGDALGAAAAVQAAARQPRPLLGLSGVLTAAPLQRREAEAATGLPTYDRDELATPLVARLLLDDLRRASRIGKAC